MISGWFGKGTYHNEKRDFNLLNDTIKVMLVTPSFSVDRINMEFVSSASSYELSGQGYTGGFGGSGRLSLSNKNITVDSNGISHFTANSLLWAAINAGTVGGILLIKENTSDSDSYLILYLGSDVLSNVPIITNGTDLSLSFGNAGVTLFDPTTGASGQLFKNISFSTIASGSISTLFQPLTASGFSTIASGSISTLFQPLTASGFSTIGSASTP